MIYVHVPFCRSFCTYCDFYSELACKGKEDFEGYLKAFRTEVSSRRDEILQTLSVSTLYIGGGTPSVLPPYYLSELVKPLSEFGPFKEFTVEVNPDDITPEYAGFLRSLGVNRISMGVQCLDDRVLRWMNRRHDSQGAARAFSTLRAAGYDNISVDVIFGLSGEVEGDGQDVPKSSIEEILGWEPEHISAYQLSVEEGSALGTLVSKGLYHEAPDERCRGQYDLICKMLGDAGYRHYEISNWARPGREALHNSAYWTRAPYVGLGPGAHSLRIDGNVQTRSWNSCCKDGWSSESEILTGEEIREERIMLGLRTADGVEIDGVRKQIPESQWFVSDSIILDALG